MKILLLVLLLLALVVQCLERHFLCQRRWG